MSRIGKKPIAIPSDVTVKSEDGEVFVKGPKGELRRKFHDASGSIIVDGGFIEVKPGKSETAAKKIWGTNASHIKNMLRGVTEGFSKSLEIDGIGYRAEVQSGQLVLNVGFSHQVFVEPLDGVTFRVNKSLITISGIDKEKVGEMAARVREIKKPEPYKGKGIRYQGEIILRKAGKKAVTTTG